MRLSPFSLPAQTRERLKALDPAAGRSPTAPAALDGMAALITASAPSSQHVVVLDHAPQPRPARRRSRLIEAGVIALVTAAVAATFALRQLHDSGSPTVRFPTSAASGALLRAASPLIAGHSFDCGGATVPAAAFAAPADAESGSSASSQALRQFLAHNPFEGMGSVTGQRWLLLSQSADKLIFGQRVGAVGIGPVVTLAKQNGAFQAVGEGGCSQIVPGRPNGGLASFEVTAVAGRTVGLTWMSGSCDGSSVPGDTLVRTQVLETPTAVHVLLTTQKTPADIAATGPKGVCLDVGLSVKTSVTLKSPLGNRTLYNDASLPADPAQVDLAKPHR